MGDKSNYAAPAPTGLHMNKLVNHFVNAFRAPPQLPARTERGKMDSHKEIIRARVHGSIRLQLGHWYTRGDVNGWRKSFETYSFTD